MAIELPGSKIPTEMCFPSASISRDWGLARLPPQSETGQAPSLRLGYSHLLSHALQHFERLLQFFFGVRGGHDGAHARFAFGDGGKCDAGSEHSFFEYFAGKIHGPASVAHDDGRKRLRRPHTR